MVHAETQVWVWVWVGVEEVRAVPGLVRGQRQWVWVRVAGVMVWVPSWVTTHDVEWRRVR